MQFDWDTEDEDVAAWAEAGTRPHGRPRRRWLLLLLLFGLASGWLGWRAVQRQVTARTDVLAGEVRAAHRLVALAVAQGDPELLASMLSGREPAWTQAMKQRLVAGRLLEGTAGILGWAPASGPAGQAISFSPELDEAVLVAERAYVVPGRAEPVRLRQTHVYRRGENHWLLSPPTADFWGEQGTASAGTVSLIFPARDAAFARRLLPALAARIQPICTLLAAPCSPLPDVRVRLDPAPRRVLAADPIAGDSQEDQGEIVLPAPSLLGEPAGAAAETALVEGYAALFSARLLNSLGGYRCCAGRAFQEALLARQVETLGLPAGFAVGKEGGALVDDFFDLNRLDALWAGQAPPAGTERQAWAFVHFLLAETALPAAELQRQLVAASGLRNWLNRIERAAGAGPAAGWETAWFHYLHRQANEAWGDPPAWPDADLHFVCYGDEDEASLYRYQVAARRWQASLALAGDYPSLMPAPGDAGVFLFDLSPRELTRLGTTWWHAGEGLAFDSPGADVIWRPDYTAMEDPLGRYVTMNRITTDEPIPEGTALFDMSTCDRTGCRWQALPGRPLWSPAGTRLLLQTAGGSWLQGTRAEMAWEPLPVGRAGRAFWTGRGEIGTISPDRQQLTFRTDGGDPRPVAVETLLARLPSGRSGRWRVEAAVPILAGKDALLVSLAQAAGEVEELFLLEEAGTRITPLLAVEDGSFNWRRNRAISPGGRWLLLFPYGGPEAGPRFILYDLQTRQILIEAQGGYSLNFSAYDWEETGEWLVRLAPHAAELIAPAGFDGKGPYRHFIPTPGLRCSSVAWVKKG